MADPARSTKTNGEEQASRSKLKDAAAQLGVLFLTSLITGAALACGNHCYVSTARRLGGRPDATVTPIKRVV